MHFRAITRIVGLLVILFSGTMIVPGLVALIYRDGAGRAFTQTFFVALAIGSMLWWPNRKQKGELKSREGFLIVVLFWTVLGRPLWWGWTRFRTLSSFIARCCSGSAAWGSLCWR